VTSEFERLLAPDTPLDEALRLFAHLRTTPAEARAIEAVLARAVYAVVREPLVVAVASALVDRGEPVAAMQALTRATSSEALMLRAELLAGGDELAAALALVERVLLRDFDWPGARERHARWREALGVSVVPRADPSTTMMTSAPEAPFRLLREVGRTRKPVLLKRGMAATLEELLMAAEYVMSEGNYQVILCERGVRTFVDHTRNTLDLAIVPAVQRLSHLPIIVDPSHGTGKRNKVVPLARAAIAVGADGLIVEVHHQPDKALSDGAQSIYPQQFADMVGEVRQIARILHRDVPDGIHLEQETPAAALAK